MIAIELTETFATSIHFSLHHLLFTCVDISIDTYTQRHRLAYALTVSASTGPLSVATGSGKADFLVFRPTGGESAEAKGAVEEPEVN